MIYKKGAILDSGDHIPNVIQEKTINETESIIKHVLIADDIHLNTHHTRLGTVKFIQASFYRIYKLIEISYSFAKNFRLLVVLTMNCIMVSYNLY